MADKDFDLITFGEIMLRLSPPTNQRIGRCDSFEKHAGGAELNVASGVSLLGLRTGVITQLPHNDIGFFVKNRIRFSGVSDDFIIFDDNPDARLGIYFYENGAYPRKPKVVYDRRHSSIWKMKLEDVPESVYASTKMFYTSGITLAVSENLRTIAIEMIKKFKQNGAQIAFDVNYRATLWDEATARETIKKVLPFVDILFISEESCRRMFQKTGTLQDMHREFCKDFPNIQYIASSEREVISPKNHSFTSTVYSHANNTFYTEEPYRNIDVVDRIGSGDAFCAGVLFGLLKYGDPKMAMEFGNATCATKNTVFGDLLISDFNEISAMIASHKDKGHQSEMNR
ncbi:MAG: sugar kinase [Treponemataceae bacterium]|nr:sugar kinase [Treponema sp.]MBD5446299.1 sugar kinase [Treponema sp.]MDE6774200.1 sugar kinase [Treponemataceae bacterium]